MIWFESDLFVQNNFVLDYPSNSNNGINFIAQPSGRNLIDTEQKTNHGPMALPWILLALVLSLETTVPKDTRQLSPRTLVDGQHSCQPAKTKSRDTSVKKVGFVGQK